MSTLLFLATVCVLLCIARRIHLLVPFNLARFKSVPTRQRLQQTRALARQLIARPNVITRLAQTLDKPKLDAHPPPAVVQGC